MKSDRLAVTVRPAPDQSGTYLAIFTSPVLGSTFSVIFPDSITGALALHDFAEMVRLRYEKPVELVLETDLFPMRSKAMEDVLAAMRARLTPVPIG